MREYARLAHAHYFSQGANAQALQTNLGRQPERGVHDGGLGLLAFVHDHTPS